MGKPKKKPVIEKADNDEITAEALYYARKCGITPQEAMEIIRKANMPKGEQSHNKLRPEVRR
ncbi:MAG: hypothetical protein EOS36_15485 [Mesorhizobium sp.]|uniref:hypothetical protein n=1 Tax=Mesorhizobium sp. TaxID=1871066 RepID=UPI000FE8C9FA|nr:hypothetical protein [Mesorhizobium sp.]RWD62323.1 MAG: hypothetical protein EOS36_15485 [Mesorhizobium sp.]RWE46916.1 MAG: hypothetical protein EOS79_11100 [Mesorhizobium sp.]